MVLEPIKVFDGSFSGAVLYENPNYQSPNLLRRQLRLASAGKYINRVQTKAALSVQREEEKNTYKTDPTDDIFEKEVGKKRKRAPSNVDEPAAEEADDGGREAKAAVVEKLKRKIESALPQAKRRKRMNKKQRRKAAKSNGHQEDNESA